MTTQELRQHLNSFADEQGLDTKNYPKTLEVDHETYANVVQDMLNSKLKNGHYIELGEPGKEAYYVLYEITTKPAHNGILYKGVELILKR